MRHFVPPDTAINLTCAERARMGFQRLVEQFGLTATVNAARSHAMDIDDHFRCMVALASGTDSYSKGCRLLGIAPDGEDAKLFGFWMLSDGGPDYEAYKLECAELRAEFQALSYMH